MQIDYDLVTQLARAKRAERWRNAGLDAKITYLTKRREAAVKRIRFLERLEQEHKLSEIGIQALERDRKIMQQCNTLIIPLRQRQLRELQASIKTNLALDPNRRANKNQKTR